MGLALNNFILIKKYFTTDILTERMKNFDFGDYDRGNRPQEIKHKKIVEKHIKMSASKAL